MKSNSLPNDRDALREALSKIEYWQGTDGDPDYPEDVYGGLPDDVIDEILCLVTAHDTALTKEARKDELEQLWRGALWPYHETPNGHSMLMSDVFKEIVEPVRTRIAALEADLTAGKE